MLAGSTRSDDTTRRIHQERESLPPTGSSPACRRSRRLSASHVFPTLFLLSILFASHTPLSSAATLSHATHSNRHFWLIGAPRAPRTDTAHSQTQANLPPSLIEQVRFGQKALSFENGVTVGPDPGNLAIQFAPPSAGAPDHLRYRLFGFDTEWKEAGKDRQIVYTHLAPGRYEFDVEPAGSSNWKSPVVESIPIVVIAPWWLTAWFRALCIVFLLAVIFALHRLRVYDLLRHAKNLQGTVNQTRAELTLAVRTAGDAQVALKEQALKDSLTGLWNRRALFAMLEREVYRAQRDRTPVILVMIDLDHFKKVNDTHGHLAGDEVLREAAERLLEVMRPYDFAGRYGGEEFLIVLPSCSPHNGIRRAEDLRRAIAERPFPTAAGSLSITCSLGVAAYDGSMPPDNLIHLADEALYRAKRLGRNCVCA